MLAQRNYRFSDAALAALRGDGGERLAQPHFATARSANALDRARVHQAAWLFERRGRRLSAGDLMPIWRSCRLRHEKGARRRLSRRIVW